MKISSWVPALAVGIAARSASLGAQAPAPVYVTVQLLSGASSSTWGGHGPLHASKFLPKEFNTDSVFSLASTQLRRAGIVVVDTVVPDGATVLALTLYADTLAGSEGAVIAYYLHASASRGVALSQTTPEFVPDPTWTSHQTGYVGKGKDEDVMNMRSGTGDLRLHRGPVLTALKVKLLDLLSQFVQAYQRTK